MFPIEFALYTHAKNSIDTLPDESMGLKMTFKCLVECNRYKATNKVGVEVIRSFNDVIVTEQANGE
jgi:hypothetical protein